MSTPTLSSPLVALNDAAADVAARLRASVVAIRGRAGSGSGTAWPGGLVVTNSHVVRGDHARVHTAAGDERPAAVVARDADHDLVALRVEDLVLPPVATRATSGLRAGELVMAIGHAWGGNGDTTLGVVAAAPVAGEPVTSDVRLAPGNSGGPLSDAAGRVVGINAMIANGMALAVSSETVDAFLAAGWSGHGLLGIVVQPVAAAIDGRRVQGLLVTVVDDGSAAELAGLIPGDVVLAIDGAGGDVRALAARLRSMRAGSPARLELVRGGARRTLDVVAAAA